MSAIEFRRWQAFYRVEPFGQPWSNWVQSWVAMNVNHTIPRKRGTALPKRKEFEWRPGEPLFIQSEKRKAKRKAKRERRRT